MVAQSEFLKQVGGTGGAPGAPRWLALAVVLLFVALVVLLVWMTLRFESGQKQLALERDAAQVSYGLRSQINQLTAAMQDVINSADGQIASIQSQQLRRVLLQRPELQRVDVFGADGRPGASVVASGAVAGFQRDETPVAESRAALETALRLSTPIASTPYFVPLGSGVGVQAMDVYVPAQQRGEPLGALRAVVSLPAFMSGTVPERFARDNEVWITEADGTFIARAMSPGRGRGVYVSSNVLDLPGLTMLLRVNSLGEGPAVFPNLLTALVIGLSTALAIALVLLGLDVRRRLKGERALAAEAGFRQAMEDSLVTGLRARDMQGVVTYVNPAFCDLVGYGPQELLGRAPPMPYWPAEAREEYGKRLTTRMAGQIEREAFEAEFVRKDGKRVAVWVFEAPLKDAQGRQTGWMACVLDVTEKNRSEELNRTAQERLAASARLASMGEVASTLAHELNQPLAAIAGFVGGARNLLAAAPAAKAMGTLQMDLEYALSQAQTQAQRAGQVIKSVSDFVRRRVPVREPVALADVLRAIDPLIALAAKKHRVRVRQQLPADLPAVIMDKVMFEQVLLNLARNGIEAMSGTSAPNPAAPRELLLSAEHDCQSKVLRLHVRDYGGGMDAATAAQLFTPFFTTKKEGMGMGLAICRSVAESHGGRLTFATKPGEGTTFTLTLPV